MILPTVTCPVPTYSLPLSEVSQRYRTQSDAETTNNNATIPQMTAVPAAERDHVLHLLRSSPSPNQLPKLIPTLPSILSNSIAHLQILDSEISALTAKIRALEQNRAEWSAHQSRCQSLLAPIRSLPMELLQLIFENLVLNDKFYHPYDDGAASHCALASISCISHVSHLWRSVAIVCPRLWTTLQPHRISPRYLQYVVLPRTTHCGLNLALVNYHHKNSGTAFLSHFSHLIQRLVVLNEEQVPERHNNWANLTHLHIDRYDYPSLPMFATAPKLHTMTLFNMRNSKSSFPWAQIRVLTIQWSKKEELQLVIQIAPNLNSLTLEYPLYTNVFNFDHDKKAIPIPSPSLQTLELILSREWACWGSWPFLLLTLPNLRTLHFRKSDKGSEPTKDEGDYFIPPASEFHAFQQRSQCQIIVLSIINMPLPAKDLVDFLSLMPALQEFTFVQVDVNRQSYDVNMFLALLDATQEADVLLKLKSLTLELESISETLLVNAVSSRRHPNSRHVSYLEFVSVVVTTHVFDAAAIDPLVRLRAGGLRIVLQDISSRY